MNRIRSTFRLCAVIAAASLAAPVAPALAQGKTLRLGVPGGPPPIFAAVIAIVAEQEGFFKKHGVEVEVKYPE